MQHTKTFSWCYHQKNICNRQKGWETHFSREVVQKALRVLPVASFGHELYALHLGVERNGELKQDETKCKDVYFVRVIFAGHLLIGRNKKKFKTYLIPPGLTNKHSLVWYHMSTIIITFSVETSSIFECIR